MKDKPIVLQLLHKRLINRAQPDGKIGRKELLGIVAQRLGKIAPNNRDLVIEELTSQGLIVESNRYSCHINKDF